MRIKVPPMTYAEAVPGPGIALAPAGIRLLIDTMREAGITVPREEWPSIEVIFLARTGADQPTVEGRFGYEWRDTPAGRVETGRTRITMRFPSSDAHWRHVLRHEIAHYRQYLRGQRVPFDELEAEAFVGEYVCDWCHGGNVYAG